MARTRVQVISLGGTIAMMDDGTGGVSVVLQVDDLIRELAGLDDIEVKGYNFRSVPSSQLTFDDVVELARLIQEQLSTDDFTGVVVTHGTDTIEETAFVLDLLISSNLPVVITGAMRDPNLAGSDGRANLAAAVQTAASRALHGAGVVVVLNDEIHAARFVRKVHSSNPAAFASVTGPIGWISEGRPPLAFRPVSRISLPSWPKAGINPRVPIVTVTFDDDGEIMRSIDARGVDSVVVEALGAGNVPAEMVGAIAALSDRVPVVLVSRTGSGEVHATRYNFPGSAHDLHEHGVILSGRLDARKARILLSLLLRVEVKPSDVGKHFQRVIAMESP
jgi:L-asparaginase